MDFPLSPPPRLGGFSDEETLRFLSGDVDIVLPAPLKPPATVLTPIWVHLLLAPRRKIVSSPQSLSLTKELGTYSLSRPTVSSDGLFACGTANTAKLATIHLGAVLPDEQRAKKVAHLRTDLV